MKIVVICGKNVQCECNQPQFGQSTIWTNYIMIVKTTSNRNVCCMWKRIVMFQIIFINDGCQIFINGILVGDKGEWCKLIPIMITLDPIPQVIIEVVSFECKTNCCNGGVNAIKYNSLHTPVPNRKSNTVCYTADVSEFWKWLNHWS